MRLIPVSSFPFNYPLTMAKTATNHTKNLNISTTTAVSKTTITTRSTTKRKRDQNLTKPRNVKAEEIEDLLVFNKRINRDKTAKTLKNPGEVKDIDDELNFNEHEIGKSRCSKTLENVKSEDIEDELEFSEQETVKIGGKLKRSQNPKTRKNTKSEDIENELRVKNPKTRGNSEVKDIEDILDFNKEEIGEIRVCLLDWYDKNKRDLPWRRLDEDDGERKGYGIWVSEVMLQQTQVVTVVDYYNRWMKKWPTVADLSLASLEEVNEMWAGLGYYRRAKFLLEGAKKIIEEGGKFPRMVCSLKKVPGIGDYTAGAIASIAFNESVPLVDGNVVRVLTRLRTISANPKDSVIVKKFWRLTSQLVDPHRPGDFNQALMELGATICTPTNPTCSKCPISTQCHALSQSQQGGSPVTNYPPKVIKTKQRNEFSAVCVLQIRNTQTLVEDGEDENRYLLVKRPDKGLLAGLWEFPSVLLEKEASLGIRRRVIDDFLKKSFNLDVNENYKVVLRDDVGEYTHIFSHIRLKMFVEVLVIELQGGTKISQSTPDEGSMVWKCVEKTEVSSMGLTSGVRKVYTMAEKFKELNTASETLKVAKSRRRR